MLVIEMAEESLGLLEVVFIEEDYVDTLNEFLEADHVLLLFAEGFQDSVDYFFREIDANHAN